MGEERREEEGRGVGGNEKEGLGWKRSGLSGTGGKGRGEKHEEMKKRDEKTVIRMNTNVKGFIFIHANNSSASSTLFQETYWPMGIF